MKTRDIPETTQLTFSISTVLVWAFLFILKISVTESQSLITTLSQIPQKLYYPHFNIFYVGSISGINILNFFYLILACSFLTILFIKKALEKRNSELDTSKCLTTICSTLVVLFLIFQTMGSMQSWSNEIKNYSNLSLEEKNKKIFGLIYLVSNFYNSKMNQELNADFITDLNISKDPEMYFHRSLAYHLYPIDIRGTRNLPADSVILFEKNDAINNIPKGFKAHIVFDEKNILATKQSEKKNE